MLIAEDKTSILSIGNIPLSDLSMWKLLFEENVIAAKLWPSRKNIPTSIPLTKNFFCKTIKVSKLDWLRRCTFVYFGPHLDSWSHILHYLPLDLLQKMEKKILIAKPLVSEIQRKAKAFERMRWAWKEGKSAKNTNTKQTKAANPLIEYQILLTNKRKSFVVNLCCIDLTIK